MIHSADVKYKTYVKGKSVIFVGPAITLIGKKNGEFIDSHDVVIRTNGAFPVLNKYHIDYGKKCDSLYINSLFARETQLPIGDYLNHGLKFLSLKEDKKNMFQRYKSSGLNIRVITKEYIKSKKEMGILPLMGNYIIYEILKFNPKSLYITGMSLYSEESISDHYLNEYLPNVCNIEKLDNTRVKHHNPLKQDKYLKDMLVSNKVTADDSILKILNL